MSAHFAALLNGLNRLAAENAAVAVVRRWHHSQGRDGIHSRLFHPPREHSGGAKNVDNDILSIARLMGATRRTLLWKVILPSATPGF